MLRMLGLLAGVLLGQFYVADLVHKTHGVRAPVAVLPEASANSVTWAHVSPEVDQRLREQASERVRDIRTRARMALKSWSMRSSCE